MPPAWNEIRDRPIRSLRNKADRFFFEFYGKYTAGMCGKKMERIKIHILTAIEGVSYPATSAILMFYDKVNYPVIDIRVWQQLYKAGMVTTNPRGQGFRLNEWITYLDVMRRIATQTNLTARQVEKRLFDIDRIER